MDVTKKHGWLLYGTKHFNSKLLRLVEEVERLVDRLNDEAKLLNHPLIQLYDSIDDVIHSRVPANPNDESFRLGKILGPKYKNWRRVKRGMPHRYRLFFMFRSTSPEVIIYAHFNDDDEIRRANDKKHDIYERFKHRLDRGDIPNTIDELLEDSAVLPKSER